MINLIDRALEGYLRAQVPLPESSIAISFDTPDKAWAAALNRPTVNVFLWEVERSVQAAHSGLNQRQGANGIERRQTNPTVELRYLVTAWASEVRDEHQLLGRILRVVVADGRLPGDSIPPDVVEGPCVVKLGSADDRVPGEFWSALGGRLKPGLQLQVAATVNAHPWQPAAAPPTEIEVGVTPVDPIPGLQPPEPRSSRWAPTAGSTPGRLRRTGIVTGESSAPGPA